MAAANNGMIAVKGGAKPKVLANHAERKPLAEMERLSIKIREMGASRPFCKKPGGCAETIRANGGTITSPATAVWK